MTCVVGFRYDGKVTIGADSAGVAGWGLTIRSDPKVFRVGPYLIGFTTSFRMGQLLRYSLDVPDQDPRHDDYRHMVTTFVDAVRTTLKEGGVAKKSSEVEEGGTFLVGYKGQLYEIESDYQVGIPVAPWAAVGCGAPIAHGAMHALAGLLEAQAFVMDGESVVRSALFAAEAHSAGVRGPFVVETLTP